MHRSARTPLVSLAAAIGAALLLGCGGVTSAPGGTGGDVAAAPTAVVVTVGQAIDFKASGFSDGNYRASVTVTTVDKDAKTDNSFEKPERGRFVAATVTIAATEDSNDLGPSNFRLVGGDGTVYKAEILLVGISPMLDAMTEIKQGQKKTGKIVFDCDKGNIQGARIELNTDGGATVGYWKI